MPKPTKGARLGGTPTHERIILRNLATQLFEHGKITTTETKARRVQPLAEKLITKAKRGDLHARRLVLQSVADQKIVAKLFDEIAPAVAERQGGYTRITKIGPRKGDNAPMAIIEVVTEAVVAKPAKAAKKASAEPKTEPVAAQAEVADVEATEAEVVVEEAAPEAAAATEIVETEAVEADADAAEEVADEAK